jgi:broad specificity phosphatase PhoE
LGSNRTIIFGGAEGNLEDADGERNARRFGERLKGMKFAKVFTSPLQRAVVTPGQTRQFAGSG